MAVFTNNEDLKKAVDLWCNNRKLALKKYDHISLWNTKKITDMTKLFYKQDNFNNDINNWDVSNVTDMFGMFEDCLIFNKPLDKWNIRKVKNMSYMFLNCRRFNKPLDTWDLKNVDNVSYMFKNCRLESSDDVLDTWFRTERKDDDSDVFWENKSKEYKDFVNIVKEMDLDKIKEYYEINKKRIYLPAFKKAMEILCYRSSRRVSPNLVMEIVKWFIDTEKRLINSYSEYFGLIEYNHFDILKYIHSLNPNIFNEGAFFIFNHSCKRNNIEVIKWFYSFLKPYISDKEILHILEFNFISYPDLIRWVFELGIDTSVNDESLFRTLSIYCGDLKTIKLLLELRPDTNITSNNHEVFLYFGEKGEYSICEYLESLKPDIYFVDNKNFQGIPYDEYDNITEYEEYFQCSLDQDEYDYPSFFYGIYNDNYRKVLDPNWYCNFCDFTDTDFEKVKKHEEICNK